MIALPDHYFGALCLERWIFGDCAGQSIMACIASAFDASYDPPNIDEMSVVAGLVGRAEDWDVVEREWQAALRKWPNLGGVFHLSDLTWKVGHEDADLCAKYFARIIGGSDLRGVAATVSISDFHALLNEPRLAAIYKKPHYLALRLLFETLSHEVDSHFGGEPCAIFLDSDYDSAANAAKIYSAWCEDRGIDEVSYPLGTFQHNSLQKQCADLVAGAIRKSKIQRWALMDTNVSISKALESNRLLQLACPSLRNSMWSKTLIDRSHSIATDKRRLDD